NLCHAYIWTRYGSPEFEDALVLHHVVDKATVLQCRDQAGSDAVHSSRARNFAREDRGVVVRRMEAGEHLANRRAVLPLRRLEREVDRALRKALEEPTIGAKQLGDDPERAQR